MTPPRQELAALLRDRLTGVADLTTVDTVLGILDRLVYTVEVAEEDLDVTQFGELPGSRFIRNRFLDVRFCVSGREVLLQPRHTVNVVTDLVEADASGMVVGVFAARKLAELGWTAPSDRTSED